MKVVSGPIGREIIYYQAPPAERLADEMDRFFCWWEDSREEMDGILRAGMAHLWFVAVHPFEDGNKRTAAAIIIVLMDLNKIQFIPDEIPKIIIKILKKNITNITQIERCIKDAVR